MPTIPTDWLTMREVAGILRTSVESVRRAMVTGELRSADLAGGRKTRQVWLAEYVEERSRGPVDQFRDPIEVKNRHSSPARGVAS